MDTPKCVVPRALVLFIALFIFRAATHAQCCDYTLVMHDAYGDGWNGGQLQVSLNGSVIGTYAAASFGSTAIFTVCNGDAIALDYTAGDYENENSYVLFSPFGLPVFADGPIPTVGPVLSGTGDCDAVPLPGQAPCSALPIDTADCQIADNTGVVGTGIDPGCANYQGGDLWFAMPVPEGGNVRVSTHDTGGLADTGLALWTGADCFHLTNRGCDDDNGDGTFSLVTAYELPMGETIYIQVFGYSAATGSFELCIDDLGLVTLDSSELPIVLINTQQQTIPQAGKIHALMEIKYSGPGALTYITDPPNVYNGDIGIGIHGATSSSYPQTPYSVETRDELGANSNVSILGMPEENDWLLLSNFNDRSFVRNELAFDLSRRMGQYAPRTHLCEVLQDSLYKGIYVLSERIKRDSGRVDIARLNIDENTGDDLTGGYILEQGLWNAGNSFQSNYSPIDHPGFDVHFLFEYPAFDVITAEQRVYIAAYVDSLEDALYGADFMDPALGYRKYLDVPSFIDYFLVNELARNNDGFKKSQFFHKDKDSNGGRLVAGPVWDFDWAWKNIDECSVMAQTDGSGWSHQVNDCVTDNHSSGWYVRLLQDSTFANELRCTYEEYRTTMLDTASIFAFIDSVGVRAQNAQARHFQRWPILGASGPAPEMLPCATTYIAELDTLKGWIAERLEWLDANMPGHCSHAGMDALGRTQAVSVYPNPSDGHFRISGTVVGEAPFTLVLQDVTGREMDRTPIPSDGRVLLQRTIVGSGTYFYSVQDRSGPLQRGKLIVQ